MNPIVKITRDDDGEKIKFAKWCLVVHKSGSSMALCSGQVFGLGESGCEYKRKVGKITCPECIGEIKYYKSVEL